MLQSPSSRLRHRRLLSFRRLLCRRPRLPRRRTRGGLPVRSPENAEKGGKDQRRRHRKHAFMATRRLPCPCRRKNLARRRSRPRQPCQTHRPSQFLPRAHALHTRRKIGRRRRQSRLYVKRLKRPNKPSTPWNGSRASSFIFRTNTSSSPDTSGIIPTSVEACAKRREPTKPCRRSRPENRRPNSSAAGGRCRFKKSTKSLRSAVPIAGNKCGSYRSSRPAR